MEDIFKPNSLSINQLFSNADSLYQIPRYQRPYSWGDEQLEKLWDDLIEALENDPNYFLGSVITAKPEDSNTYLDIVDGQQRLTTLTILLCVFRDLFPNINIDLAEIDPSAISNTAILSSIRLNDRFERLRLRTHANHQSDFDSLILNGDTTQHRKPSKIDLKKEDPKFKFINSAFFFTEKLRELGEKEAGIFINYLFKNVKVIRIDCQSVAFAIKLFQVLNDRGLDLSNSDLIKSYLIGQIQKRYAEEQELKKQKEDQFMSDWQICETYASHTETTLNDLFVMYEYYVLASNPKKSLYDELIEIFKNQDPNEVISDVKKFIINYKNELYDKDDKIIYSLFYIPWSISWRSILLTALTCQIGEYEKFIKIFRRYYYLNWIAGYTYSRVKQTAFNTIKLLKEGKSIQEINEDLEANLAANDTIRRAVENLNGNIYQESWCKPLLFMIEYQQTDNSSMIFYDMKDRNIHVEHIIPQAFEKNEDWKHLKVESSIINSGANLTLLSGKKNIQASNNGFESKLESYRGKGFYNENSEGITAFRMTQKIVNDIDGNNKSIGWNNQSIQDRWQWFCNQTEILLEIDLSAIRNLS